MKITTTVYSKRSFIRPYISAFVLFLIFFLQSSLSHSQSKTHYVLSGVEASKQLTVKKALDHFSLTKYRLVEENREIEIKGMGKVILISGNELKEKYDRTIHDFQFKSKSDLKHDVIFLITAGEIEVKEIKLSE